MNYPYTDEYMIYDFDQHRYILTNKYCLDYLGLNLTEELNKGRQTIDVTVADSVLDQISLLVYNWIYSFGMDNDWQEYCLAKCPSLRPIIMKALGEQVLYFRLNGMNHKFAGVNQMKGTIMEIAKLRNESVIDYTVEQLFKKKVKELGVSILYPANTGLLKVYDYEEENY